MKVIKGYRCRIIHDIIFTCFIYVFTFINLYKKAGREIGEKRYESLICNGNNGIYPNPSNVYIALLLLPSIYTNTNAVYYTFGTEYIYIYALVFVFMCGVSISAFAL